MLLVLLVVTVEGDRILLLLLRYSPRSILVAAQAPLLFSLLFSVIWQKVTGYGGVNWIRELLKSATCSFEPTILCLPALGSGHVEATCCHLLL